MHSVRGCPGLGGPCIIAPGQSRNLHSDKLLFLFVCETEEGRVRVNAGEGVGGQKSIYRGLKRMISPVSSLFPLPSFLRGWFSREDVGGFTHKIRFWEMVEMEIKSLQFITMENNERVFRLHNALNISAING